MPEFNFKEYQRQSRRTWSRVNTDYDVVYPVIGLFNEAGEFAGKLKKILRDRDGIISDEDRKALSGEMGDIFWYYTQICTELGLDLEEVAAENLEKVLSRLERGKIGGDGDDR